MTNNNEFPKEIYATRHERIENIQSGAWCSRKGTISAPETSYTRTDTINQWHPIETAPKDQTDILVVGFDEKKLLWTSKAIVYYEVYENRGFLCSRTNTPVSIQPTHWMPLPDAPTFF